MSILPQTGLAAVALSTELEQWVAERRAGPASPAPGAAQPMG